MKSFEVSIDTSAVVCVRALCERDAVVAAFRDVDYDVIEIVLTPSREGWQVRTAGGWHYAICATAASDLDTNPARDGEVDEDGKPRAYVLDIERAGMEADEARG